MAVGVETETGTHPLYPRLFTPWEMRGATIKNKIVYSPTCPTWVGDPFNGIFTDIATEYYAERAKGEAGLILIGGTHVHQNSLSAPLLGPQLFDDRNVEPLRRIADEVHRHGAVLGIQLMHTGMRSFPLPRQEPTYDEDATWYTSGPSQVPLGEFPGGGIPKEMSDAEIEEALDGFAAAAERAARAGLDGVELHLSHGYLGWQFLSPLYNKRTDRWGGSPENRLRFAVECFRRVREAVGTDNFVGYRINSTSFWEGDLELDDVKGIVTSLEAQAEVDYVSVSAGVHHAFIHTPMDFEAGWEKGYARAIKDVSSKPVFLVGRITTPEVAEQLLREEHGDAICLGRQTFADPEWARKALEQHADDIRRCVAANLCWRTVSRGQRVQCVYNPAMGREGKWGAGTLAKVAAPRKVLVLGAGPAGLECARVAAARGHQVTVLERESAVGGHARLLSLLPTRTEYGRIGTWLGEQAAKNGATIQTSIEVTAENLDSLLERHAPDHVVVATGSRIARDGFQGWTAAALPGVETANAIGWDDYATGRSRPSGDVVVLDDTADVVGPLTAVGLAQDGARVKLVTRWPMAGLDTVLDVYLAWLLPRLYRSGVEIVSDHFIREIRGREVQLYNVHAPELERTVAADTIVMVTARHSENALAGLLATRGIDAETIGCATAPRGTYEAVYEGHRHGRRI
jgi:2,4-dienoyl-CoA reductase-like NADH-dependent reductase (Old Yellow Enzyme family)